MNFREPHNFSKLLQASKKPEEAAFLSVGVRRIFIFFRLFGLAIGLVSTGYFAFAFWLIFHGITVSFFENNSAVATGELLMALFGFITLLVTLMVEIVKWR